MKTKVELPAKGPKPASKAVVKIFGVGGAGVQWLDLLLGGEFTGAAFVAIDTDGPSLATSPAPVKIQLETKLLRGLGTGGDPERGRALAEEQFSTLQTACEGATVIFILAGLGGGAGSGISPVLARAAKESGALVLAFATLPFLCEGNRRRHRLPADDGSASIAVGGRSAGRLALGGLIMGMAEISGSGLRHDGEPQ